VNLCISLQSFRGGCWRYFLPSVVSVGSPFWDLSHTHATHQQQRKNLTTHSHSPCLLFCSGLCRAVQTFHF
jgi:hypothetical protein